VTPDQILAQVRQLRDCVMGRLPWWEEGSVVFTWPSTWVFIAWPTLESFARPSTGVFFMWPSLDSSSLDTLWNLLYSTLYWRLLHLTLYWSLLHLILSRVFFIRPSTGVSFTRPSAGVFHSEPESVCGCPGLFLLGTFHKSQRTRLFQGQLYLYLIYINLIWIRRHGRYDVTSFRFRA